MIDQPVLYRSVDGTQIAGVFNIPVAPSAFALMMHGIAVDKDEWQGFYSELAVTLSNNNVGSLRFDFRGHGESAGTALDASIVGDLLDVRASISEIRTRWPGRITFIGTSVGAGPAILIAAECGELVDRVVLIAPVLDFKRTFLEPETEWARASFNPESLSALYDKGFLVLDDEFQVSARMVEEFRWIEPFRALQTLKVPVLLIHGDEDSMVPIRLSRLYFPKSKRGWRFVELKGADHGFAEPDDDDGTSPRSHANKARMFQEVISFLGSNRQ